MNPASLESLIQRAISYQKRGNYGRARIVYNGLIRRGHLTARVLSNLGAALYESGSTDAGLVLFEEALDLDPRHQDAWNNLCIDASGRQDWQRVLTNAERVISEDSANKPAMCVRAKALMSMGSFSDAQNILLHMLSVYPDDLELRELVARCFLATSDFDSALAHLLYILSLSPGDAFASIQLAEIAAKSGDLESSMAILKSAHAINPKNIVIMERIAQEYQLVGCMHDALAMYELALSVDPDSAVLMARKAYCYSEIDEPEKFFEIYDLIADRYGLTPEMLLSAIFVCSVQGVGCLAKLRQYSEQYWQFFARYGSVPVGAQTESVLPVRPSSSSLLQTSRLGHRRKKIAIVTGGLGSHVESCFLGSFLLNYSKDLLEVEVVSSRWLNDSISDVLSQAVDRCHSISDLPLQAARDLICRQEYELIIETTGFTSGSAIHVLADRCAPVQCHWIGYHASTYMPSMDYFIADAILAPQEHSDRFTESVLRLDRAWLAATPFQAIPEAISPSGGDVMLGSFSQMAKLTRKTLDLWAKLLLNAPQCKLMFKDRFVDDSAVVDKIAAFFSSRGVDPERLLFVPRSRGWFEHMAMYNQLDIALDTTPWSSATTAFDALSMGVPLIGIKGQTTCGLMSSSVLYHCGKRHWISAYEDEYIEKNIKLIEEVAILRKSKRELQAEILSSQLFDGASIARAIESFIFSA